MPGIALLPDELLVNVLILAGDDSIEQKFTVAQISRRWRSVALSSPLLWSSFYLRTTRDYSRLPTILKICGPSALLDIELRCTSDCRAVLQALVPYAARIRSFQADPVGLQQALAPLFDGNLDFPALKKLKYFPSHLWGSHVRVASAPVLRILELGSVVLDNMEGLLSPTLEVVRMLHCKPWQSPSELLSIFERCPRLVSVIFHNHDMEEDAAFSGLETIARRPLAPALHLLELCISLEDSVKVLDTGFGDVVVPEIDVRVCTADDEDDMARLVGSLIRGLGALVAFEERNEDKIFLRDDAGHVRSMSVWDDDACWNVQDVWRFLAERHSIPITASVQHVQIYTKEWNELAAALEEHPLQTEPDSEDGVGITMRVVVDWDDLRLVRKGGALRTMSAIAVPGLRCVEMESGDREAGLTAAAVLHVLRHLDHDRDPARPCRLVIHHGVPKLSGDESNDLHDGHWQKSMQDQLALELTSWEISFK